MVAFGELVGGEAITLLERFLRIAAQVVLACEGQSRIRVDQQGRQIVLQRPKAASLEIDKIDPVPPHHDVARLQVAVQETRDGVTAHTFGQQFEFRR